MTTDLTPEALADLAALEAAATDGPYTEAVLTQWAESAAEDARVEGRAWSCHPLAILDVIAELRLYRNAAPALIDAARRVQAVEAERDELRAQAAQSRNAIDHYVGALGVEKVRVEKAEAEVERLRRVIVTNEADYREHRDNGYRMANRAESERDEARAEVERLQAALALQAESVENAAGEVELLRAGLRAQGHMEGQSCHHLYSRCFPTDAHRDGRDRLAAWLASNGVDMPDTVALEAVAFILVALDGETP